MNDGGGSWESFPGYQDRLVRVEQRAREPASPAGRPREHEVVPARPRNCERELEAKNAENARLREELKEELEQRRELEKRAAELKRQLGAAAPASADDVASGTPTWASSAESAATLSPAREPASPAGRPREHEVVPARPRNCERELEAKNAENARLREELKEELEQRRQLEKRVAELKRQLEVPERPYRPFRPYWGEGPWDQGPGGPGFGP
jgi:hypothetical protein